MTGEHQAFFPLDEGIRTMSVLVGPGIKQNVARRVPIRITDLAPTICASLGTPFPAQVEGSVILDAYSDISSLKW